MWIKFNLHFYIMISSSDVNKDLGPKAKAKDTGHKVKAKAKALGYQGQGQGLEMSKPITKTEGQSWQWSKIILTGTLLSDSDKLK